MKQILVYLAGAIDHVDTHQAQGWRERAAGLLQEEGLATFSPAHAFVVPDHPLGELATSILSINQAAITQSDALLANLSMPSIGTGIEVAEARSNGKPVVCYGGNWDSLFVCTWDHVDTLEEAVDRLIQVAREPLPLPPLVQDDEFFKAS